MITIKRQSNRKWEKRPQLYRGRFYYLKRFTQVGLALSGVILVISLLLYFQNSDTLFIKRVEVLGKLRHITKDDVILLSGITPQDKLFSVSLKSITQNIMRFPWIEEVKIRREFPDTIQIAVTERKPAALLKTDSFYYVDGQGKVFKRLQREDDLDLPIISGFSEGFVTKYPQLSKNYLKKALAFLNFIREKPFYEKYPVSEVAFDPVFGYTVFTEDDALEIFYGREDIKAKQDKLERFVTSPHFNMDRYVRMDLASHSKVIARGLLRGE